MTFKMEFWNSNTKGIEVGGIKWRDGRISREATLEVLSPLTGNIIGNDDVCDPCLDTFCEGGCDSVVDVDMPGSRVSLIGLTRSEHITSLPSGGRQPHLEGQTHDDRRPQQHPWQCTPANVLCMPR